jgi:hypothetical protein
MPSSVEALFLLFFCLNVSVFVNVHFLMFFMSAAFNVNFSIFYVSIV